MYHIYILYLFSHPYIWFVLFDIHIFAAGFDTAATAVVLLYHIGPTYVCIYIYNSSIWYETCDVWMIPLVFCVEDIDWGTAVVRAVWFNTLLCTPPSLCASIVVCAALPNAQITSVSFAPKVYRCRCLSVRLCVIYLYSYGVQCAATNRYARWFDQPQEPQGPIL